jgi:hypothetical protein
MPCRFVAEASDAEKILLLIPQTRFGGAHADGLPALQTYCIRIVSIVYLFDPLSCASRRSRKRARPPTRL